MEQLKIRLFGRFDVQYSGEPLDGLRSSKAQELLAYLLLHRHRSVSREFVADLLWANSSAASAKKNLRQTLWQLHSALSGTPWGDKLLQADGEWISLCPSADIWVDVFEFENACRMGSGCQGTEFNSDSARLLRQAADLYCGDLLEGFYDDWCLFERERLQSQYMLLLEKLMIACESLKDYEAGLDYGWRLLFFDRAHERTHRRLMRLHALRGDRTEALRQFERCRQALADSLEIEPAAETVDLYRSLRGEPVDRSPGPHDRRDPSLSPLRTLQSLHDDLARLLGQVQQQMHRMSTTERPSGISSPLQPN